MLYEFKISDSSRHVWDMSVVNSKFCHCVTVTSPNGMPYHFCWRKGELVELSARGKMFCNDGQYSFRDVVSLVPMWILKKMDFYYKVHIAE